MEQVTQQTVKLLVKKLASNAKLPYRVSPKNIGYDVYALGDCFVKARGKELIKTGLSFQVPQGNLARISTKLGLALKSSVTVETSFVAEDYSGEVCILLINHSDQDFQVNAGDEIAQVIIEKVTCSECVEIQDPESTGQDSVQPHELKDEQPELKNEQLELSTVKEEKSEHQQSQEVSVTQL